MLKCLVHCCCCCCCCCSCCFKLLLLSLFLFIPSSGLKCLVRCSCCRCSHCCYCSCHYCGVVVVVVVVVAVAVAGDDGRISFVVVVVLICQLHLTFTRRTVNLQRYSRLGDMHKRNLIRVRTLSEISCVTESLPARILTMSVTPSPPKLSASNLVSLLSL